MPHGGAIAFAGKPVAFGYSALNTAEVGGVLVSAWSPDPHDPRLPGTTARLQGVDPAATFQPILHGT